MTATVPQDMGPDVANDTFTPEERGVAEVAASMHRELLKCRDENGFFYLVIDDNGGAQFDKISEVKDFLNIWDEDPTIWG